MSLGLPADLAPIAIRRSFASAQHTVSITVLLIAILMGFVLQTAQPDANLWLPLLALLPMLGLLFVVDRVRPFLWAMSYFLVGGAGVYFYALGVLSQPLPIHDSDGFSFLAVKVALILTGGVVLGVAAGIAFAIAGYVIGELAVGLALAEIAKPLRFEVAPLLTLLIALTLIVLIELRSSHQVLVLPRLQRAAREEYLAGLRNTIEVKAAALMHDTVLNHLAAIASSAADRLDPLLRQQIGRDVGSLLGDGWLTENLAEDFLSTGGNDWRQSALYASVREGRALGLNIMMTGDLASVGRVQKQTSIALGLAVKQCLVNVLKHSGTLDVELTVYSSESEVSVMVVDGGCGFVEAATGADRLGLRASVRQRIELVGGTVDVWSTLGVGTSIMIRVPARPIAVVTLPTNVMGTS